MFSCVSFRPWRKSLPGSCRNRKCSSRWAESRSALTPPPRAASPSSTRSPASTPPVSRGNLRTYAETYTQRTRKQAHTPTVKTEPVLPCPHPLKTVEGCKKHFCFWTSFLSLQFCSARPLFCSFCQIIVIWKENYEGDLQIVCSGHHLKTTKAKQLCPPLFLWLNCFFKESSACRICCFWLLNPSNFWWLFAAQLLSHLDICTKQTIAFLYCLNITLMI